MVRTAEPRQAEAFNLLSRYIASLLVALGLVGLWLRFGGPHAGDWDGYAEMWNFGGSWLARQGRDRLFVWSLGGLRTIFGADGYDSFRLVLYGSFILFAVRCAWLMPSQTIGPFVSAAIVLAATMIKSLVQIRDGIAFFVVILGLINVYARGRNAWLWVGFTTLVASQFHNGAYVFLVVWVAAMAFYIAPDKLLAAPATRWLMTLASLGVGVGTAFLAIRSADFLEFALRDLGTDTTVEATGGALKFAYWGVIGTSVFIIRDQLGHAAIGRSKFAAAYATVLGCGLITALYAFCVILVFTKFYLPAVTTFAERLIISSLALGLLIVGFRGKANLLTFAVAVLLIADASRFLIQLN